MGIPTNLISVLKDLVHQLVIGNYVGLEVDGRAGRLTAGELKQTIIEYGRVLIELPDGAFEVARAYPIQGRESCWTVDLDLWTVEEGKSDLTLSVTVQITPNGVLAEIDDLHVL